MKLLVAVPATKSTHLPFQQELLDAVKANLAGVPHDLLVGEANELGWQFVVDAFNAVADKTVAEGYDYVWILESDVVPPAGAFSHLLSLNVDVAVAAVPAHRYPDNPALDQIMNGGNPIMCVATFLGADTLSFMPKRLDEVKNRVLLTRDDSNLEAGTGCILIKRRVFESGIRFLNDISRASYDIFFWKDIVKKGFSGAVDGYVVCKHLGT